MKKHESPKEDCPKLTNMFRDTLNLSSPDILYIVSR